MFELFITFAKIGIMTFGGGLAMLPMLERELVTNKSWIDKDTLMDYYAIGQCTPGIIAVNVATLVGKKQKGLLGSILATLGIVFPSIVIILILAIFFNKFKGNEILNHAFTGARIAVCALVLKSIISLFKKNAKGIIEKTIYFTIAILSIVYKISPIILILSAAIVSIIKFGKEDQK